MTFSALKAFRTTYVIVFTHMVTIVRIAWLPAAVLAATNAWLSLFAFDMQDALIALPEDAPPEDAVKAVAPFLGSVVPLLCVAILASAVLSTGFLKWVLRGEEPGIAYAAFGRDELRLLAGWLLVGVVLLAVYLAALIVSGMLVSAIALVSPGLGASATAAFGGAVMIGVGYCAARLSLVGPLIVRDRRIALRKSLVITAGNGWRLALFWVLLFMPVYAATTVFNALFIPDYFTLISADAEGQARLTELLKSRIGVMSAAGYLLNIPVWAVLASAGGVALRLITGEGIADPDPRGTRAA